MGVMRAPVGAYARRLRTNLFTINKSYILPFELQSTLGLALSQDATSTRQPPEKGRAAINANFATPTGDKNLLSQANSARSSNATSPISNLSSVTVTASKQVVPSLSETVSPSPLTANITAHRPLSTLATRTRFGSSSVSYATSADSAAETPPQPWVYIFCVIFRPSVPEAEANLKKLKISDATAGILAITKSNPITPLTEQDFEDLFPMKRVEGNPLSGYAAANILAFALTELRAGCEPMLRATLHMLEADHDYFAVAALFRWNKGPGAMFQLRNEGPDEMLLEEQAGSRVAR